MIKLILKLLNKTKYLYYVGRHDVLPPPLNAFEEKEALEKLAKGDNDARDLLIEHNLRLVVYVAKRYDTNQNGGIEDLISIGTIGLVKAINTFNYDGNELLLSDIIGTDSDIVKNELEQSDQRTMFYEAFKDLSKREKEILMLRYGLMNYDELTQKDVAKMMGISQSYISRLEKKIIKKLRNKLNYNEIK